jgi:hypothetical protein
MLPSVLILAQLLGVVSADVERERRREQIRAVIDQMEREQRSPATEFRLVNHSGQPLDAVLVACASDRSNRPSFVEHARQAGPYGAEPTALYRKRWPGAFTLTSVTLIRGKDEVEHQLNYVCQPGGRVLIVVGEKGAVSAREDR